MAVALWRRSGAGEEFFAPPLGFLALFFELRVEEVALFGGEFGGQFGIADFFEIDRGHFDGAQGDDVVAADDADVGAGCGLFEVGPEMLFGLGDGDGLHEDEEGQATSTPKKAPNKAPRHQVAVSGQPPDVHSTK